MRVHQFLILFLLVTLPIASVLAQDTPASIPITAEAINSADLATVPAELVPPPGRPRRRDRTMRLLPKRRPTPLS